MWDNDILRTLGKIHILYKAAAANDQIVSQSSLLLIAKSGQAETVCFDKSFRTQMVSRPYKTLDTIAIKCLHEPFRFPNTNMKIKH